MEARIFYKKVQDRANLQDQLSARRATKAVLQTLHWRLPEGEADDIEATLPPELKKVWRGNWPMVLAKKVGFVDKLNKDQFVHQVKGRARLGTPAAAERMSAAVISVLKEAIPKGETKDMLSQLPDDLKGFIKAA